MVALPPVVLVAPYANPLMRVDRISLQGNKSQRPHARCSLWLSATRRRVGRVHIGTLGNV